MTRQPWTITRDMFLSLEEVQRLVAFLRAAAPDREPVRDDALIDRVVIETLLWTGLRSSEFCRLAFGDAMTGDPLPRLVVRQRASGIREVYIPRDLARLISRYAESCRPRLLPPGARPGDRRQPLFLHERQRPFERTGLYRRVVSVLDRAGLGGRASVQLLRHTYGYLAYLRTGGNLLFVQRQLGHAHAMVTAVYAQFVEEDYAALATRVANIAR